MRAFDAAAESPSSRSLIPISNARCTLLMIVSSLKGFSMKSTAPARIAATAIGTSAWPVIAITGSVIPCSASWVCSCRPLMPGMRTSINTHPQRSGVQACRNSGPEPYVSTSNTAVLSSAASEARTPLSSSTMMTLQLFAMLWFDDWKSKMKGRPTSRGIGRPQPAAVGIDNRLADRQANSHTILLCREILGKHLIN